ncbi:recombinase family protein [Gemmobacter straminiformis]|uniref:Recombinase family protein n=2 Tax=Paragemmobacter straminiformis TaxID=2045119 RepID=A0A842I2R1_9RHOB|nr:recombinase family protein [Gemmobacter straminiformis]
MAARRKDGTGAKAIVGYVRVSTERQGREGISIDLQREAIHEFARGCHLPLIEVFEDVASGAGASSLRGRQGLLNALQACRDHDAVLVVWDWSRLSRHAASEENIKALVPSPDRILSLKDGEGFAQASEQARLKRAELQHNEISRRTKEGMGRKKAEGASFGNPNIREAQVKGTAAASDKANAIIDAIVRILRAEADPDKVKAVQVVDQLNQLGVLTGQNQTWTVGRVRVPLRQARKRFVDVSDEEDRLMRANPLYGLF